MNRTILDIHILQTVPPSNLNRDDTGSPKTAVYGGVRRSRVSSQAWKRATRKAFGDVLDADQLGTRTKQVVKVLADRVRAQAPDIEEARADELATETLKAVGLTITPPKKKKDDAGNGEEGAGEAGYLVFLSARQIENLAGAAIEAAASEDKLPAALKKLNVRKLADRDHSVDVALFGRMVADASDINVDAAAQVAHAIAVHAVENEYDYFTAVDDLKERAEETGAGMIGTVEFNSATLYRYATVDVNRLLDNLGDASAAQRAVEAFVRAFVTSMPTGKQNTFANRTLPDVVVVRLRESQSINFVGAFERPVSERGAAGRVEEAVSRLVEYARDVEQSFDETPLASWVVRVGDRTEKAAELGEPVSVNALVDSVGAATIERLSDAS